MSSSLETMFLTHAQEIAKRFLEDGIPASVVSKNTRIPIEVVMELQTQLQSQDKDQQ